MADKIFQLDELVKAREWVFPQALKVPFEELYDKKIARDPLLW